MKHVKLPSLIAVAAMAMMALFGASTASATVLCKTTTNPCGGAWQYSGEVKGSLKAGTTAVMKNTSGVVESTCNSGTAEGTASAGGATSTVTGSPTSLSLGGCTNTTTINNAASCEGEIHYISGTSNGTATAKGCTAGFVEFGVTCKYGAGNGIDVGVAEEGSPGVMKINAVVERVDSSSFLCPGTAVLEAEAVGTAPQITLGVAGS